ncbi:hypothetical protein J6590_032379 [Homalodisca vitripennis]|nr:hypothetical protein J6590_032379 [Homalodisca vitripennis]
MDLRRITARRTVTRREYTAARYRHAAPPGVQTHTRTLEYGHVMLNRQTQCHKGVAGTLLPCLCTLALTGGVSAACETSGINAAAVRHHGDVRNLYSAVTR